MSERPAWISEMVDILFIDRMCGATCEQAANLAWGECHPDSPKNKGRSRDDPRRRLERERQARRRARMNIKGGEWLRLRWLVFQRDGECCTYCGATDTRFHVDHIVPVSRGGTNHIDNLCVACYECNSSKADLLLEEWEARRWG